MSNEVEGATPRGRLRSLIRTHFGVVVLVVSTIATILGALGWAVPGLRNWLGGIPGVAWTLALLFGALWIGALVAASRRYDEILALKGEIATLSQRLDEPSEADLDLYNWILDALPLESGMLGRVSIGGFSFKRWSSDDVRPLEVLEGAREEYFDSPQAEDARGDLFRACRDFSAWLSREGAPTSREGDRLIYTIQNGYDRERAGTGGWPAFDKAQEEARDLAERMIEARREFERRCREQGLFRRGRSSALGG